MTDWNAAQYSKFKTERTLPAIDLANAIDCKNVHKILDIGCGTGNSTAVLINKFPEAKVVGADNSDDMLSAAKNACPSADFIKLDAENDIDKITEKYDIVFSNACIQWIPNHRKLINDMFSLLRSGGVLAVQIPQQYKHPVHKILNSLADSDKWNKKIKEKRTYNNLSESEYFDILSELSENFRIWEITYFFSMPSHQSIAEWYKGTGLRPYLAQLTDSDQKEYTEDFLERIRATYPVRKNGNIIFEFPRLFFTVTKE